MGSGARKPFFVVSGKVGLYQPTQLQRLDRKLKISLVAILDFDTFQYAKNEGADQTAHVCRLVCAFVCNPQKTGFPTSWPILYFWSEPSSVSILFVSLHLKLWQDCSWAGWSQPRLLVDVISTKNS